MTSNDARKISVKSWKIIAEVLSKDGWNWRCVSAVDTCGRTIWIADTHRGDRKRFVVHADDKLTASIERNGRFELDTKTVGGHIGELEQQSKI